MDLADRKCQLQLQLGLATALGVVEGMGGQGGDGGVRHHRQHVRQRTAPLRLHGDLGMHQIGNLRLDLSHAQLRRAFETGAGLAHRHAVTVKHQLPRELRQCGPGQFPRPLQARWHVGVGGVLDLRCDVELPLLRPFERQVVQVAAHLEAHLV